MSALPASFDTDPSQLVGPTEAARLFGVLPATAARWARTGKVPTVRMPNGRLKFSRTWIEAYMADHADFHSNGGGTHE